MASSSWLLSDKSILLLDALCSFYFNCFKLFLTRDYIFTHLADKNVTSPPLPHITAALLDMGAKISPELTYEYLIEEAGSVCRNIAHLVIMVPSDARVIICVTFACMLCYSRNASLEAVKESN